MRVRVDSDRVLGMLIEKAQFSIARRYASLVGSTASEVTVKEVNDESWVYFWSMLCSSLAKYSRYSL